MLQAVAFQNFIYFREYQSLKFEVGPNFIVGPNASGKSAIFELIRRCLSHSANASTSRLADENLLAFVLCKFEIREKISNKVRDELPAEDVREVPAGCHVYSYVCMKANKQNKAKRTKEMYKLVCITKTDKRQQECHLEYYSDVGDNGPEPKSFTVPSPSTELLNTLKRLLKRKDSPDTLYKMMTEVMRDNEKTEFRECEAILKALHNAVVVTFPIRSPGPIQWSHSENIGKGGEHYNTASKKAEILQALLNSKNVDVEKSNKIFETIIYPLKYQFKKKSDSTITVNGGKEPESTITVNDGVQDIPFLKVPEGIIEAKQFSVMFAHKKYQTLLLEEPARGMHPHMIQKFRDLVFRTLTKEQRKVLLIITHETTMLNQWSMSGMFICRRTINTEGVMNHCVVSLKQIGRLYQFEDFVKEMVLSEAVLFVEGFTDKKVIRSVFDRVLEATESTGNDGLTEDELTDFQQMAARTQIISIRGAGDQERIKTLQEISNVLKSTCVFLFDKDKNKQCKCLAELQPEESDEQNNCLVQLQEKNRDKIIENLENFHPEDRDKIMKCLEKPQQKNYTNKKNWKNRASFCARTLFKTPNSKENNEDEEEKNCKDIMKTRLTTGNLVWEELRFEETRTKVETPKVVSFISRILLPLLEKGEKAEDSEALSNVKAEDSEPLSEEKAEDSKALSKEKAGNSKALSKEKAGNSKALSKEKAEENEHLSKEKEEGEPRSKEKAEDSKALSKEKAEDTKALSREKAEECESLSKKKAEESKALSEGNHFLWKSGNLEDVICRSLLKSNKDLLQEMFECKHHGSKDKNAVKEKIKEMDIKTAHTLSTCLLKNGEMKDLLEFLVKIQKIDPNNK